VGINIAFKVLILPTNNFQNDRLYTYSGDSSHQPTRNANSQLESNVTTRPQIKTINIIKTHQSIIQPV